jgi:hypothetical protein
VPSILTPSSCQIVISSLSVWSALIPRSQRYVTDSPSFYEHRMSSNYPRHAPLSSSLPTDYAILSHFASDSAIESDNDSIIEGSNTSGSPTASPRRAVRHMPSRDTNFRALAGYGGVTPTSSAPGRRLSMPYRMNSAARRMSYGGWSAKLPAGAREREHLLATDSRLVGTSESGQHVHVHEYETWQMWLQEFKIICKYTAPVFGSVKAKPYFCQFGSFCSLCNN